MQTLSDYKTIHISSVASYTFSATHKKACYIKLMTTKCANLTLWPDQQK